jgi:hypothetical protein
VTRHLGRHRGHFFFGLPMYASSDTRTQEKVHKLCFSLLRVANALKSTIVTAMGV